MRITRRSLLASAALGALSGREARAAFAIFQTAAVSAAAPAWVPIPVGGGGYQSKLSIHPSGFMFTGTDAYGCYAGSTKLGTPNVQLQTSASMPASFVPSPYIAGDSYEAVVDKSNANNLWWYWSCRGPLVATVLKSVNQGASWSTTGFPITAADGNGNLHAITRQMMAVDPVNSNVVYVGGYDALRVTLNGGTTFSAVSGITAPGSDPGVCAIQFDPTSGTTTNGGQTVTARILLSVYGTGVFVSTNGGATFSLISGSPTQVTSSQMGIDGNYYAVSYNVNSIVRISTSNALTTISVNNAVGMMALNPNNPAQAMAWDQTGGGNIVFNGPINTGSPSGLHNGTSTISISSPDCPWLNLSGHPSLGPIDWDPFITTSSTSLTIGTGSQTLTVPANQNIAVGDAIRVSNTGTLTNYMRGTVTAYNSATGSLIFTVGNNDTSQYLGAQTGGSGTFAAWNVTKDRQWYCCGVGLIYIDAASSGGSLTYISQTFGIESLSSCVVLWPSGEDPQLICSDFPFRPQAVNPVGQSTGATTYQPPGVAIADGNFMAWPPSDPSTLWAIVVGTAYKSTNQGASWSTLAANPSALSGGHGAWIAASTDLNAVVASNSLANYTTDGGATWPTPTGMPSIGQSPFTLAGAPICADSVTPNKFYCVSGTASYVSTNSGATWATTGGTVPATAGSQTLVAVPGHAGHLLYAGGANSGSGSTPAAIVASSPSTSAPMQFSSNGGVTWTALPNLQETINVAVGAAKPGGNGYPSFAFAGWVSNVFGIWQVDNFNPSSISSTTYVNIGTFPDNIIDFPDSIAGDSLNWGWWILSGRNSGWRFHGVGGSWP